MNTDAALDYLAFVSERHAIWLRRQTGQEPPWTDHPILASRKFTNVFRVLDYGSQFLLKQLLEPGLNPRDTWMRCFLYRHTGRWQTWELFELHYGRMPTFSDLDQILGIMKLYREKGHSVFTNAYLVFPQSSTPGTDKLESIIDLTWRLFSPHSPGDIVPALMDAQSPETQFKILRANKGVGDFMAMQVLTDWGYSSQCGVDRENDFVVPGPGARKGAAALGMDPMEAILWAKFAVEGVALPLPGGGVRLPSLMDLQNTMCEFSKFVRYQKQDSQKPYQPAHPGTQPAPQLPEHWSQK